MQWKTQGYEPQTLKISREGRSRSATLGQNHSRVIEDDKELMVINKMKRIGQGYECNEMNKLGLSMKWTTQGYGWNKMNKVRAMNPRL